MKNARTIRQLIAATAAVFMGFAAVGADGDPVVVTNTGMFEVSSPTTFSYVTNYWYNDDGYGLVSANVTVDGNSYLRIGKTMETSDPEHGTYFATNADDDVTFTIGGSSGVYFTYRNSNEPTEWVNAGVDPAGKENVQPTYSHLRVGVKDGEKDSSGRMKFVLNSNPNVKFGNNIKPIALWASYLHIESSLKAHASGYIDILELNNSSTTADIHYFCNHNPNYPTRILFNGGKLRNNKASVDTGYGMSQFLPDAGTKIVLEGVNGNDITINKAYFTANSASTLRRLNGGEGTLRFQGDCDVRLADSGSNNPIAGGSAGNRGQFILDPAYGPIEWKQKGELVLASNGWLMPVADYMLPCDEDIQTIRLQDKASLDLNGYKLALRSLISDAKAAAMVTNMYANYKNKSVESLLVFGTNDIDGVFSANTCDHVSVEKVGAGTLVVEDVTMDVGNTGTGTFEVKKGTVILAGTNKIGNENMHESAKLAISNEATVIRELVVNVASGKTTEDDTLYADYANGIKLRLRKTGAGTLVLKNPQNSFTGGIVIDGGSVKAGQVDVVWTAGGTDASTGTAANWKDSKLPNFSFSLSSARPLFGEGGSEAVFPAGDNYLAGMEFTRDGDFTVRSETPLYLSEAIELIGAGHVYTVDAPVEQSVAGTLAFDSNTKLTFEHGYKVAGDLSIRMSLSDKQQSGAEVEFKGPVKASGTVGSNSSSYYGKSPYLKVKFYSVGNEATQLKLGYVNTQFFVSNAFENATFYLNGGNAASRVDFNNTRQETPQFQCIDTKGNLYGDYPATLAITEGWTDRETAVAKEFGPNKMEGWLKLEKSGAGYQILGQTDITATKNYASYGDLEVSGGTLELMVNNTWLNGTNFIAKGSGTLKFNAANQVSDAFARVHIEDNGKVEIPENVTISVYAARTNGIWLAMGNYTCKDNGAADAIGIPQLKGKGVLSVSAMGYVIEDDNEPNVHSVVISKSWVDEKVPQNKTIYDPAANGFKYWKCYVLGLTPNDPNSLPIIKGVQNANPNKLAFALGNVTYNASSGVLAEYTIKESTAINGTYTEKATNTVGQVVEFDLPAEGNLHYYQGVIRYRDAQ